MIVTVDLGTTVTKVTVWDGDGPRAEGRHRLETRAGPDGRSEQDPATWWPALLDAAAAARRADPDAYGAVEAVGFAAARQSFVPVDGAGRPLGPALLWSDRRAGHEATELTAAVGRGFRGGWSAPAWLRRRTGQELEAGSVAAKLAWLARHEPRRLEDARWVLTPRDLLAWRLTGEVATDVTVASASGLYDTAAGDGAGLGALGAPIAELLPNVGRSAATLLPDVVASTTVLGPLLAEPAIALGLRRGLPVVVGAGDRPCEVLGTGASARQPLVSWGTTANVSRPRSTRPEEPPGGLTLTRGALGGWLLEGGLAAAGSLLDWLGTLTGTDAVTLLAEAADCPPGARGVQATAWLGGARAPWWRPEAQAAFAGLRPSTGRAELARAAVEAVGWDVVRCLEAGEPDGSAARGRRLVLGGSGASSPTWRTVLGGISARSTRRRRSTDAASAGAALVVGAALGLGLELDRLNPPLDDEEPDPALVAAYAAGRPAADAVAAAVLGLSGH